MTNIRIMIMGMDRAFNLHFLVNTMCYMKNIKGEEKFPRIWSLEKHKVAD